jgi:hypothetical protein
MHWREDALNEAPNRLGAAASPIGQKSLVALLDPQSQDRPGDHELLDLLGALEDVVGPGPLFCAVGARGSTSTERALRAGAGSVAIDPSDLSGGTARCDRNDRIGTSHFVVTPQVPPARHRSRCERRWLTAIVAIVGCCRLPLWGMSHGETPSRLYTVTGRSQELP